MTARTAAIIGIAVMSGAMPAATPPLPPGAEIIAASAQGLSADGAGLSVMTYNVKGLPWPMGIGRSGPLARIGARLHALRQAGRQPHVVLLQEAFTNEAKAIADVAGYPYRADGPTQILAAADPTDMAFLSEASMLAGEGMGKMSDSGLMILSDYPIVAVRQAAFPVDACAGFDCLANKGMVLAFVRVPGSATPVAILNAHLNARSASGVSIVRAFTAYGRQVAAMDAFLRANLPAGTPLVLGGDLNVGRDRARRALMEAFAAHWTGSERLSRGVLRACASGAGRCPPLSEDARKALEHNKDWQIAVDADGQGVAARRIAVPFGRETDGTMLSDHMGYVAYYAMPARRAQVAGNF